ncbi:MAG TPA: hypothetical protein VFG10_13450 [Saprospiraceae bacterium]|nr:hypothetical protein [Saprospiraceae bacterium]
MRPVTTLLLSALFLFALQNYATAQKQNNVWYFGQNAGLDFNTTSPTPLEGELNTTEGNAAISDTVGNLLFYTDGINVWDRSHSLMPNGFGLKGGKSSTQSALIVPLPKSRTKYYLFTASDIVSPRNMNYSVVDMLLNNGYGDIITTTKNTFVMDSIGEMLTAVLHPNGTDIWIVTHKGFSRNFYAYLLSEAGLSTTPVISTIGSYHNLDLSGSNPGPIRSSHDGSKIVCSITYGGVCDLFDFNASSGQLTNHFDLTPLLNDQTVYGIEFAPNDSLLYLGGYSAPDTFNLIYQLNLYADPLETTIIASYPDEFIEETGTLQMGPDKKIYVARSFKSFIDVIHQPDKPGIACQYEPEGIPLFAGTFSTFGLPNPAPYSFCPHLSLGKDTTICKGDTLTLTIALHGTKECPFSFIWYDGTSDTIKLIIQPGIYWIEVTDPFIIYRDSIFVDSVFHRQVIASICEGGSYEGYTDSGIYIDTFSALTGCDSIRSLELTVNTYFRDTLVRTICSGDSVEGYTQSGIYADTFPNTEGCPFIRVIRLTVLYCSPIVPIVAYDLDACESVMANGSHMDYTEFTPEYPFILPCAEVIANYLNRSFPEKHSCTPGINGSPAMCVTVFDSCGYQAGNAASVVIEFTIDPATDSMVRFTGLEFYEKGPLNYEWINGPGGANNFPYYFGIRVLKNGTEIYRKGINQTHLNWTLQVFNFIDNEKFYVDNVTTFRIELLPYCPAIRNAEVSAWDIDEIRIYAGCVSPSKPDPFIDGFVATKKEQAISNVNIYLSDDPLFLQKDIRSTNETGYYIFDPLVPGKSYYLNGYKNDDVRNGVSTLDLIGLQKHLLGIEPFITLDQYIAADINRSGSISVLDLIELRKLILGKYTEFPNNTSWRFGPLPQDFSGTDLTVFQEIKTIEFLDNEPQEVNFLGIKIGDLNGDAKVNAADPKITARNNFSIPLLIDDQPLVEGQPINVPVFLGTEINMEGLQLALDINNFELKSLHPGVLPVTEGNFFVSDKGLLRMSWNDSKPVSVLHGNILFTLVLVPKFSGSLKQNLLLTDDYLFPECYSSDDINPITLELEVVDKPGSLAVSTLFHIEPNPFLSTFNLRFNLDHNDTVVFRFYDVTGRRCHVIEKMYATGENIEPIDFDILPATAGIIYCQMICNGNTIIQKAVRVN